MVKHVLSDLQSELTKRNLRCVAAVNESQRGTDYAVALSGTRLVVVRRVEEATGEDHTALATMMAEGDFVWAGLVYCEREGSQAVGLIETFHLSEFDRLVSRLQKLREVFGEAG